MKQKKEDLDVLTEDLTWIGETKRDEAGSLAQQCKANYDAALSTLEVVARTLKTAADQIMIPDAVATQSSLGQVQNTKAVMLTSASNFLSLYTRFEDLLSQGPGLDPRLKDALKLQASATGPVEDWTCLTLPIALGLIRPPVERDEPPSTPDEEPISSLDQIKDVIDYILGGQKAYAVSSPSTGAQLGPFFTRHRDEIMKIAVDDFLLILTRYSPTRLEDLLYLRVEGGIDDYTMLWMDHRTLNAIADLIETLRGRGNLYIHEVPASAGKGAGGWFEDGAPYVITVVNQQVDDVQEAIEFAYATAVHEFVHLNTAKRETTVRNGATTVYNVAAQVSILDQYHWLDAAVDEIDAYASTIGVHGTFYGEGSLYDALEKQFLRGISRYGLVRAGLLWFKNKGPNSIYSNISSHLSARKPSIPMATRLMGYHLLYTISEISETIKRTHGVALSVTSRKSDQNQPNLAPPAGILK